MKNKLQRQIISNVTFFLFLFADGTKLDDKGIDR